MSTSQFAVYQLKKKPELRNLLFRTYEELAKDQIPVQMENYAFNRIKEISYHGNLLTDIFAAGTVRTKGAGEQTAAQL